MHRFFEEELKVLRSHLIEMGQKSVEQVELALRALLEGDSGLATQVRAQDDDLDRLEMEIDAEAISYISLRAPVARELRLVVVGMNVGRDLERVGDEATNIAKRAVRLSGQVPPAGAQEDLKRMGGMVVEMLQDALDAFLHGNADKALELGRRDKEVDRLDKQISKDLARRMKEEPGFIPIAFELLFVSRSLERIADHATNIAEEVIFLLRGRDVRHKKIQSAE